MIDVEVSSKNGLVLNTAGKYCPDNVNITIKDSQDIRPENISKGTTILGVEGQLTDSMYEQLLNRSISVAPIPQNVTTIPPHMFLKCKNLTEINIPPQVELIDSSAFESTGIKAVNISEEGSNLAIKAFAFYRCPIESIVLPTRVTTVYWAFASCQTLKTIEIKNPDIKIYTTSNIIKGKQLGICYGCPNLSCIIVPSEFNANIDTYCGIDGVEGVPLTQECIHNIMVNYTDRTGQSPLYFVLYPDNVNNIADEDRQIAESKNIKIISIES